jgi:hypothetical protein
MKNQLLTALFLTAATLAIAPVANAAPLTLQQSRYEVLDRTGSKSVENLQMTRLDYLNNKTKGIDNLQMTRLDRLDSQTKAVENVHKARLEGLDMRSKGLF